MRQNIFPAIFSSSWLSHLLDDTKQLGTSVDVESTYPYDVYHKKDQKGKESAIVLEFALVGFSKKDITIQVVDDEIRIETKTGAVNGAIERQYVRQGIARRAMQIAFKLGATLEKDKITSSFKDGLLKIEIPFKKKEAYAIEIA